MVTKSPATIDDVLRLADEGKNYELVDGELVELAPTMFVHGWIELQVARRVADHADAHDLGTVVVGEVLCNLDPVRKIARAADVAFVRRERITPELERDVIPGSPDLVVEIVSKSNTVKEVQRKVEDWLQYGAALVLLLYPEEQSAVLWRSSGGVALQGDDDVDLDAALSGFHCKLSDLFPRRGES